MAKSATETKGLIVWGTKSHCMQLKRLFEILATFLLQISWQSFLLKLKSLELLMSLRLRLHFSLKIIMSLLRMIFKDMAARDSPISQAALTPTCLNCSSLHEGYPVTKCCKICSYFLALGQLRLIPSFVSVEDQALVD